MISTSHRFIFVHIPKTGGNSVQDSLRDVADDEFISPRAHQDSVERFAIANPEHSFLKKHSDMNDYAKALGRKLRHFKLFATLRNPYDKLVSTYFLPHRGNLDWDEDAFFEVARKVRPLEAYLAIDRPFRLPRKLPVKNFTFLRFETLEQDFDQMCTALPIRGVQLGHRNRAVKRRNYRDCYTKDLADWVAKKHKFEIELGGYTFEPPT